MLLTSGHRSFGPEFSWISLLTRLYWNRGVMVLSGADPGCLSRIPDPDFYPSRIPDPKTATKEMGEKIFVIILFWQSQISQN
jgi:hypothetical protein